MHTFLIVAQIILAVIIIVSVLVQPGKMDGFMNPISGTNETFFAKNKSKTKEAFLCKNYSCIFNTICTGSYFIESKTI